MRIIKRNPSGRGLAGAVFEVAGPNGFNVQRTTPFNGAFTLDNLEPGEYTITEITPPPGHEITEPATQIVTITGNETEVIERIFINEPIEPPALDFPSVRIQKLDALSRENIPGALIRLRGMSSHQVVTADGQLWEIDNTGINLSQVLTAGATTALPPGDGESGVISTVTDGVWTLEGLPFGFYMAEEERAPEGYSLLPQHTAYGFWLLPPNVIVDGNANVIQCPETGEVLYVDIDFEIIQQESINSVIISFENYPFGEIEVMKFDEVTGEPLANAHFRIQGYFLEGNTNGMPIDRVGITGADGRVVFNNLPAGNYTISEIEAPPGYQLDNTAFRSISLTWGQRASTSFYNKPKTFVEVIKVDGNDSNLYLDGARFRLTDPTSGETWEGVTVNGRVRLGEGDGSFGNQLVEGKLYILTEIQAPNGYILDPTPREVIVAANNQLNTVTVRNFRNPSLAIIKRDGVTREPLSGAVFDVVYENGQTVSGSPFTTGMDGRVVVPEVLFEGESERTLIVTEITPPTNYLLSGRNQQRVTMRAGEANSIVFENILRPTLVIRKRNAVTWQGIFMTRFRVEFEVPNSPNRELLGYFNTDRDGYIILPFVDVGWYVVTEVRAAPGMSLPSNPVTRIYLRPGENSYEYAAGRQNNSESTEVSDDSEQDTDDNEDELDETDEFELDNIEIIEDPELVEQITQNMQVNSGERYISTALRRFGIDRLIQSLLKSRMQQTEIS